MNLSPRAALVLMYVFALFRLSGGVSVSPRTNRGAERPCDAFQHALAQRQRHTVVGHGNLRHRTHLEPALHFTAGEHTPAAMEHQLVAGQIIRKVLAGTKLKLERMVEKRLQRLRQLDPGDVVFLGMVGAGFRHQYGRIRQ